MNTYGYIRVSTKEQNEVRQMIAMEEFGVEKGRIKPFVIDRKNFLLANTPLGAQGSAVIFSLIQTAIENKLDPYRYLTWLLDRAADLDLSQPDTVRQLLPWNAPAECRTA